MNVTPYLTFGGNCEEAMTFYARVLGGEMGPMMRFKDMPEEGIPEKIGDMVAHTSVEFGQGRSILASDSFDPDSYSGMANVSLHVPCSSPAQAKDLFGQLSEGGTVDMALDKTFWSEAFGVCTDRFGVSWMVDCETADAG